MLDKKITKWLRQGLGVFLFLAFSFYFPLYAEEKSFEKQHPFFEISFLEIPLCPAIAEEKTEDEDSTIEFFEKKQDHELRVFEYYQLCYRESFEQCEWAAYTITTEKLEKNTSRKDNFRVDPKISTGSASLEDYRGSGYDRGHIAPAADFAFDSLAMSETFYMSNMSPQVPAMNRGIWANLEAEGRKWAERYGIVYVVTGPILENKAYKTIGINKVAVPNAYYKIFLSPIVKRNRETDDLFFAAIAAAYIIPNAKGEKHFSEYLCTIREVEKITGIDFFYKLEDEIENKIETESLQEVFIETE